MTQQELLQFANTEKGRKFLGVPEGKEVIRFSEGAVHYYTGDIAENGKPIICAQGSPGGKALKDKLKEIKSSL